tara:strand:+ start:1164 stop:1367 length:204 start_codon:yes stop_codon:yes gene_type:complete
MEVDIYLMFDFLVSRFSHSSFILNFLMENYMPKNIKKKPTLTLKEKRTLKKESAAQCVVKPRKKKGK